MFEVCIDCDWYDDPKQINSYLKPFGEYYICAVCAESRGIEP